MKIVIVGPGAMGCLFASFLSKSKEDVWLLDKNKERADKINDKGINVEGISGNWQAKVNAAAKAEAIGEADLIIICVKSYDTKESSSSIKQLVGQRSLVLTLQNGLGNIEIIGEAVGQ
jgi:2-dehydropantoate 2-reductase